MLETTYLGLEGEGVALIAPKEESFGVRHRSIQAFSWFPVPEVGDELAAILVNLTGQTILAFAAIWRYFGNTGETHTNRICTLNSSRQIEALFGRAGVAPDDNMFILPGSQRLITQQGVFGDNHDVLPPEMRMSGSFAGSSRSVSRQEEEPERAELSLDVVILNTGRVLGPDTSGLVQSLTSTFSEQCRLAGEMAATLQRGATPGALFDLLRPMAAMSHRAHFDGMLPIRRMFLHHATDVLLHQSEDMILAWAQREAEPPRLRLHRAVT